MSDDLLKLIEMAKNFQMTPDQAEAQRVSFAYGTAKLADENVTREDVVRASMSLRDRPNESRSAAS